MVELLERLKVAGRRALLPAHLQRLMRRVRDERLTYLSQAKLLALANCCRAIERQKIPGMIIEAGCALGGSSILLAACKDPGRPQLIHDVFAMIPPPGPGDGADVHERYATIAAGESVGLKGETYYGYLPDLQNRVKESFARLGYPIEANSVSLVAGLVQDTLHVNSPVALAHIDVDWYEPVLCCLERIEPHLSVGGSMILDDYESWSGCKSAVEEFFRTRDRRRFAIDDRAMSLVITKRG